MGVKSFLGDFVMRSGNCGECANIGDPREWSDEEASEFGRE